MFGRLTRNKLSGEKQPLLSKDGMRSSPSAFDKVPNDVVVNIASFLEPADMAHLARTSKRFRALVEKSPTTFEIHREVEGEPQVVKGATYAQLCQAFKERAPVERELIKVQPSHLVKKIRERERGIGVICSTGTMLTGALAVVAGAPLMAVSTPVGVTAWVGGAITTFCFPFCITHSIDAFEQCQVERDEKIQALENELKAKPQVLSMRK